MTTDDQRPIEDAATPNAAPNAAPNAVPSPRERFDTLAAISPVHRVLRPRPFLVIAVVIAVALLALVVSAYVLWTPAADMLKSYTDRIWNQRF